MTQQPTYLAYEQQSKKKKVPSWVWVLLISLLFIVLIAVLASAVSRQSAAESPSALPLGDRDYLAVLYVEGTMVSGSSLTAGGGSYDQEYLLDTLAALSEDERNRGLLLFIDSPGGEVMAASDLSDAVVAYKETTGRPVYAYGHNMAASGGYWLAAAADSFFVNRYCLTGSIGVIAGNYFDVSGLLEKYGVKVNTFTSGDQKSMGSMYETMTPQTQAIFQAMIDEYYGYFLDWVSQQRGMDREQLRTLADGRIYTATQAVENGLADQVGGYKDCLDALLEQTDPELAVEEFRYEAPFSMMSLLRQSAAQREIDSILSLLPPSGILAYYGN